MINNQQAIQPQPLAPGQGRVPVQYLRAPGPAAASPYPVSQQQMLDPRMAALMRRLALASKTGDQSIQERSVTGKDSMGRSRPDVILKKEVK